MTRCSECVTGQALVNEDCVPSRPAAASSDVSWMAAVDLSRTRGRPAIVCSTGACSCTVPQCSGSRSVTNRKESPPFGGLPRSSPVTRTTRPLSSLHGHTHSSPFCEQEECLAVRILRDRFHVGWISHPRVHHVAGRSLRSTPTRGGTPSLWRLSHQAL
jgi:hypothetical protein